jgi:peptidoglycan/xylan/chitin deacetylase (PgdA/CDA1 family)
MEIRLRLRPSRALPQSCDEAEAMKATHEPQAMNLNGSVSASHGSGVTRSLKLAVLRLLRGGGIFELVANSRWRKRRLLILCYHGTSLEDEHLWRPELYISRQRLSERFSFLKQHHYMILPLAEALEQLHAQTLPARSIALTFDDGTYDFYSQAYPLLQEFGFPATVYLTTYYSVGERPVFNLICSYMLWQRRGTVIADGEEIGLPGPLDLRSETGRHRVVRGLIDLAEREGMNGVQKDDLASRLAASLEIDYGALKLKRILQLMNAGEVREVAQNCIDIQLHTHRHRTPEDETLFSREIRENREHILELAGENPVHFCYPGGVYRPAFLPRLRAEQVLSATTCDSGLCTRRSETLLLPRFVDSQSRTQLEFESWTAGVGDLMALRRNASQKYVPRV